MKVLIEMDEAAMWTNGNVRDAGNIVSHLAVSGNMVVEEKANLVEKYKQIKAWCSNSNILKISNTFALAC
jgi:hypothetical protein